MTAAVGTSAEAAVPADAGRVRRPRFPALDGYRGVAALMVVFCHVGYESGFSLSGPIGGLVNRLDIGVTLFFVLSGFLLYRPFAAWHAGDAPRPRTGRFLWHRALRILPAYWVLVTVVLLAFDREAATPRPTVATYLLLQIYQPSLLFDRLGQTWTLCTEVSWYLALPLLAWALWRPAGRSARVQRRVEFGTVALFVAIGLAYSVVARGTALLDPYVSGFWLPHYLGWFGAGMGLAVLSVHERWAPRVVAPVRALAASPGTCWAAAFAVYALAATPIAGPRALVAFSAWEGLFRDLLYPVAATLFLLPGVFGTPGTLLDRVFSGRVARYLGDISYAVYLWHFPMVKVVFGWTDTAPFTGHFWLNLVVLLIVTLVLASASWYLVERPALRLKSWAPRRRRRPTPPPVPATPAPEPQAADGPTR